MEGKLFFFAVYFFFYFDSVYLTQFALFRRFEEAKKKIEQKYDEIERSLIEEFSKAEETNNLAKMKEIASILSHFKGYSQCVDVFIEQSQLVSINEISKTRYYSSEKCSSEMFLGSISR